MGELSVRNGDAFVHRAESRAFSSFFEARGKPRLFERARAGRPRLSASARPFPGLSRELAQTLELDPRIDFVSSEVPRVSPEGILLPKPARSLLSERELDWVGLGWVYTMARGLGPWAEAAQLPVFPGETTAQLGRLLEAWLRVHRFSRDRFRLALGFQLSESARVLAKLRSLEASPQGLERRSKGASKKVPSLLEKLKAFRPEAGFPAFRELLVGAPEELERLWELFAFERAGGYSREEKVLVRRGLGLSLEGAPSERPDRTRIPSREVSVEASPKAPTPGANSARSRGGNLRSVPHRSRGSSGGPLECHVYLSSFQRSLRVLPEAGEAYEIDLSGFTRLPTRLARGPRGELWVWDSEARSLHRLDAEGRRELSLDRIEREVSDFTIDRRGRIHLIRGKTRSIRLLSPDGKALGIFEAASGGLPFAPGTVCFQEESGGYWIGEGRELVHYEFSGRVLERLQGGTPTLGFGEVKALISAGAGELLVLDETLRRIHRIHPTGFTRATQVLAESARDGQLRPGKDGQGYFLDPESGRALLLDGQGSPKVSLSQLLVREDGFGYRADFGSARLAVPAVPQTESRAPWKDLPCAVSI